MTDPKTLTDEQIMSHWNRRDECLHGSNAVIWFARAIERATREQTASTGERRPLPHPGSPTASALLDSMLAEYDWPANPKNAARAGWEAAQRFLQAAPVEQAGSPDEESAWLEWKSARADMLDTRHNRLIFSAGYRAGAVEQAWSTPDETLRELCEAMWRKGRSSVPLNMALAEVGPKLRALATPTKPEMQSVHPAAVFGKEKKCTQPEEGCRPVQARAPFREIGP